MKNLVKKAISSFGFELRRKDREKTFCAMDFLDLLRQDPAQNEVADFIRYVALNARRSNSQLFQDLFVLQTLHEKSAGYFVEFGAADGIFLSNTYLLEREYGWRGIVAEPSLGWHAPLQKNRGCSVDLRCVWGTSGKTLTFSEALEPEFSTINEFKHSDHNARHRSNARQYNVTTVSFHDLLSDHNAPSDIDYLSIDTEGSELEILKSLDFEKWSFKVITVEHNHTPDYRNALYSLLSSKGYKRMFSEITRWDDWYARA